MQEEIPRAEMLQIVEHFKGKPRTDDSIREYCNLNKLSYVPTVGELADLEYQVDHDDKMSSIFKDILAELQKLEYMPELATKKERKRIANNNDEVRIAITKLFENAGISFRMVDKVANELGGVIGKIVETAGATGFNKGMEVLMHMAHARFGGEFTLKHARDYAVEVFENAKSQENSTAKSSGDNLSQPQDSSKPQEEDGAGDRPEGQ